MRETDELTLIVAVFVVYMLAGTEGFIAVTLAFVAVVNWLVRSVEHDPRGEGEGGVEAPLV
jgi:hypothetical protein